MKHLWTALFWIPKESCTLQEKSLEPNHGSNRARWWLTDGVSQGANELLYFEPTFKENETMLFTVLYLSLFSPMSLTVMLCIHLRFVSLLSCRWTLYASLWGITFGTATIRPGAFFISPCGSTPWFCAPDLWVVQCKCVLLYFFLQKASESNSTTLPF